VKNAEKLCQDNKYYSVVQAYNCNDEPLINNSDLDYWCPSKKSNLQSFPTPFCAVWTAANMLARIWLTVTLHNLYSLSGLCSTQGGSTSPRYVTSWLNFRRLLSWSFYESHEWKFNHIFK